uniref:Bm13268 n=1 Tax=Brugia malayi TaxID=6279 RepID=A0A1I9G2U0_BRUMA|nr:Bm13268 [Brugia malayi]
MQKHNYQIKPVHTFNTLRNICNKLLSNFTFKTIFFSRNLNAHDMLCEDTMKNKAFEFY